jgi:hypothetical protein
MCDGSICHKMNVWLDGSKVGQGQGGVGFNPSPDIDLHNYIVALDTCVIHANIIK